MTTYKVKVFSNGQIVFDQDIRADKIHITSGSVYLTKEEIDVFVGPITNTIIVKI